jgi:hypothetical protein
LGAQVSVPVQALVQALVVVWVQVRVLAVELAALLVRGEVVAGRGSGRGSGLGWAPAVAQLAPPLLVGYGLWPWALVLRLAVLLLPPSDDSLGRARR